MPFISLFFFFVAFTLSAMSVAAHLLMILKIFRYMPCHADAMLMLVATYLLLICFSPAPFYAVAADITLPLFA